MMKRIRGGIREGRLPVAQAIKLWGEEQVLP